jgi:hypothetical protein
MAKIHKKNIDLHWFFFVLCQSQCENSPPKNKNISIRLKYKDPSNTIISPSALWHQKIQEAHDKAYLINDLHACLLPTPLQQTADCPETGFQAFIAWYHCSPPSILLCESGCGHSKILQQTTTTSRKLEI